MTIKKKKDKDNELINVQSFVKRTKFLNNKNKKQQILKRILFVILVVLFVVVIFHQVNKTNREEINYLNRKIEFLKKRLNKGNEIIGDKTRELNYFHFKDFYYTVIDSKMTEILYLIYKYSKKNDVNPYHILLIMSVESAFNPTAVSNMGAYGLMQVHYVTWKTKYDIREPKDLFDIEFNIRLGCEIFRHYLDKADGDFGQAAFLYNTGRLGHLEHYKKYYYNMLIGQNKFYRWPEYKNGKKK